MNLNNTIFDIFSSHCTIITFDNVIPTNCKLATFPDHKEHLQEKMLHFSQLECSLTACSLNITWNGETNEVMMLFLDRCQMFLLVKPKKKKKIKINLMSTKRKTYQIFTLFNKEISKNLPKYQAWSNGASRGNIEKKGAQPASPGMHFKLLSTALVFVLRSKKKNFK
jgi:hypothetical protein